MSISPFEDERDGPAFIRPPVTAPADEFNMPVWTQEDQNQALARGWGVFEDADRGPEIQRYDQADLFDSDQAACRHVRECLGTSYLCRKAMLTLGVMQREWREQNGHSIN